MNLVIPNVTRVIDAQQDVPLNIALMKKIERCGRIAYRSEDRIADDSYIKFIKGIVKRRHYSVLEHARFNLVFRFDQTNISTFLNSKEYVSLTSFASENPYTFIHPVFSNPMLLKLNWNMRTAREVMVNRSITDPDLYKNILLFLKEKFPPIFEDIECDEPLRKLDIFLTEDKEYRTYHVVTDRGVLSEWTRHRLNMSFTVESTRYCNYNKRGMTFCLPIPFIWSPTEDANDQKFLYNLLKKGRCIEDKGEGVFYTCMNGVSFDGVSSLMANYHIMRLWLQHMETCERVYNEMIERKLSPQEARSVLPHSLKSEFCVTGTSYAWKHFIELRTAKDAHPQIRYLANKIQDDIGWKPMVDDNSN